MTQRVAGNVKDRCAGRHHPGPGTRYLSVASSPCLPLLGCTHETPLKYFAAHTRMRSTTQSALSSRFKLAWGENKSMDMKNGIERLASFMTHMKYLKGLLVKFAFKTYLKYKS